MKKEIELKVSYQPTARREKAKPKHKSPKIGKKPTVEKPDFKDNSNVLPKTGRQVLMEDLKQKIIKKSFSFEDDTGIQKRPTIFLDDLFEILETELLNISLVGGLLLPDENWIKKNAPLNPDANYEDVLIHNWWIGGAKDYRNELLKRLHSEGVFLENHRRT
ncbi:MAG: hypothetical protein J7L08_04510 [Candidatus Aenigmarchaeota archaeon]|nr:hypothetical protein [Candidatus Aenigmarchaeota archaeon]